MSTPSAAPCCSTIELAQRAGVSRQTVQRWVDAGLIESWRTPGGHRRLDLASAERFLAQLDQSPNQSPKATARAAAGRQAARPLRVLVVDDVPLQREVTQMAVQHAVPDAEILLADDGLEALVHIGSFDPDLVITDIVMPHVDGMRMVRFLTRPELPRRAIIAVTGRSATDLATMGTLPPDVPVLHKPYDPLQLADLVRHAANRLQPQLAQGAAAPRRGRPRTR